MRPKKDSLGFTLIETLIYSIILGMFLLLVTQVFISVKTINANSSATSSVQKNFRQIMADMTTTIRSADSVTDPVPGGSGTTLSLNGGQITYGLNENNQLIKTVSGQAYQLTTNEVLVENLSFANPVEAGELGVVRISMEVTSQYLLTGDRQLSETLEFAVGVR